MKEIKLSKGYVAIVDDEDYDYLMQWKWYANIRKHCVYAKRAFSKREDYKNGKTIIAMHRLLLKPDEFMEVDHINHNGLDNRRENLRIVSKRENHWNRTNNAEFIGVMKSHNHYRARIRINNKKCYIGGAFKTSKEASEAYMQYAQKLLKLLIAPPL